jgi:arginyl-tRNA synthetase
MDEALAFTGETGPYLQYSAVRADSIRARLESEGHDLAALRARAQQLDLAPLLGGEEGDEIWSLLLLMARTEEVVEQVIASEDMAPLAKHTFAVAKAFSGWQQDSRYSILYAASEDQRAFRLQVVDAFLGQMTLVLETLLGIPVPERM